ncbi:hypothetical protein [Lysobacter gummosus]|uniref:hypothetical protein n=1 Tax=Lysobacter gummosus TaxID=262324 RepID=UPI0036266F5F
MAASRNKGRTGQNVSVPARNFPAPCPIDSKKSSYAFGKRPPTESARSATSWREHPLSCSCDTSFVFSNSSRIPTIPPFARRRQRLYEHGGRFARLAQRAKAAGAAWMRISMRFCCGA